MLYQVNATTWVDPRFCEPVLRIQGEEKEAETRLWVVSAAQPETPIEVNWEHQHHFTAQRKQS
jgi:ligand-binding SRPBCC domain-containing protein